MNPQATAAIPIRAADFDRVAYLVDDYNEAARLLDDVRYGARPAYEERHHYVEAQWLMLQQPAPEDFVIATGIAHSVRDFRAGNVSRMGATIAEAASPACRIAAAGAYI